VDGKEGCSGACSKLPIPMPLTVQAQRVAMNDPELLMLVHRHKAALGALPRHTRRAVEQLSAKLPFARGAPFAAPSTEASDDERRRATRQVLEQALATPKGGALLATWLAKSGLL